MCTGSSASAIANCGADSRPYRLGAGEQGGPTRTSPPPERANYAEYSGIANWLLLLFRRIGLQQFGRPVVHLDDVHCSPRRLVLGKPEWPRQTIGFQLVQFRNQCVPLETLRLLGRRQQESDRIGRQGCCDIRRLTCSSAIIGGKLQDPITLVFKCKSSGEHNSVARLWILSKSFFRFFPAEENCKRFGIPGRSQSAELQQ